MVNNMSLILNLLHRIRLLYKKSLIISKLFRIKQNLISSNTKLLVKAMSGGHINQLFTGQMKMWDQEKYSLTYMLHIDTY
jgi:hypothetical protein